MRTLILVLAVMLLASTAQGADNKLPTKFVGDWCPAKSPPGHVYTRDRWGRNSDSWMTFTANCFRGHESDCKVLDVAAASKFGHYLVKFKCHGEGETWTENSRMSLYNLGPLCGPARADAMRTPPA